MDSRDHVSQLARRFNVFEQDVPRLVRNIVRDGKAISNTLGERHGRQGYERIYEYKGNRVMLAAIGTNGFIVTVYPNLIRKEMKMKTMKIMLDYLQGPIWISDPNTGQPKTGIETVDGDEKIREISYEFQEMYFSYYEFDSHEQAC